MCAILYTLPWAWTPHMEIHNSIGGKLFSHKWYLRSILKHYFFLSESLLFVFLSIIYICYGNIPVWHFLC